MIHERRSVRIAGFDYRSDFTCLVTICTAGRRPIFGNPTRDVVGPTKAGIIAAACLCAIPVHFPAVAINAYTIQSDHVHGIIAVGAQHAVPLQRRRFGLVLPGSLPVIVRSYKSAVSRLLSGECSGPAWQRGYYDRLLRDGAEIERARRYIRGHPVVAREPRPPSPAL